MATIHFYSKLVKTDSLVAALNELDLSDDQKAHLLGIVESSLHHAILDAILSELSEKDKTIFLDYVTENDDDKIWKFLNAKIDKIEEKIVQTAEGLKKELHQDIEETKGN
ncbi:MAG TPA: hypothetical protein VLB73_01605 [Patescibacteria group bacterium]|nr:hypothetical protein [Patescibacteria group bacterium]